MRMREQAHAAQLHGGIAILGSYPPPFGGTSTHVMRLSALLDRRGVAHVIYNAVSDGTDDRHVVSVTRHRNAWMVRYALTSTERLVYVCSARLEVWLLGALMATRRKKRVLIRLRNAALIDYQSNPRTRRLASWALQNVTAVVAVSDELVEASRRAGVPAERIIHQPGFFPPSPQRPGDDGLSYEQRAFVARHQPLIAANGKVNWYQGVDLYGLDHLVEMMGRLRTGHPKIGLVISFWDHLPADEPRLEELRRRAAALGVEDQILFHTSPWPFVPVLSHADLFIRPTATDGDANSVREALYLGVPAIASDVVSRPEGTVLVRTRNLEDLVSTASRVLAAPTKRTPRTDVVDLTRIERYLDTLERLASS